MNHFFEFHSCSFTWLKEKSPSCYWGDRKTVKFKENHSMRIKLKFHWIISRGANKADFFDFLKVNLLHWNYTAGIGLTTIDKDSIECLSSDFDTIRQIPSVLWIVIDF